MTSQTQNPSFVIINKNEQQNSDLSIILHEKFKTLNLKFFTSLLLFRAEREYSELGKVFILFEDCFDISKSEDRRDIMQISSENATIVIRKNLNYQYTEQLIELGVDELLIEDQYNSNQLKQSIFVALARSTKSFSDLATENKNQFFDVLSKHYGNLVNTVDLDLNFLKTSKNTIAKFEYDSPKLTKPNLRDYMHPQDVWHLEDIASFFDGRDFITLQPLRLQVAKGHFQNFEVNLFKSPSNDQQYIINLKDQSEQKPKENFRNENNERFTAVAEATNSTIYEYYVESKLLFTANNRGIYGLIEGDHLENYFENYFAKIHPNDRDRLRDSFTESLTVDSIKPISNIFKLIKPNGRYQTILERYRIFFKDGVQFKRIGALTDITEVTAQNDLIALENQVYELNADTNIEFCTVISFLEEGIERLIPNSHCMVLTMDSDNEIESVSRRDHNKYIVGEIEKHSLSKNPLCDKVERRGAIAEQNHWKDVQKVTDQLGYKYFWTTPAINKDNEVIANIVLLFTEQFEVESIEEKLVERAKILVGMLVAKNKAVTETRSAREQYEIVAKATSDTIWDWNVQTDKFSWNKGIHQIFGYAPDEIGPTSNWWFSHVHPEDSIRVSVKFYNFLEQKIDKWQDEYRFACADGSYKYVFDRGFLEKDSDGKPYRMIGAMQDVTQQKQEEERLKLLSAAITQANDAVIITETPRSIYAVPKIVYVNPAFSKMTGYLYDEVVGKPPSIFIGKNAMVEQQAILSKAAEFNKEFIFEAINRRKNGEEYWARFSMIPVADTLGDHSHWISIQSDITDKKEQEKEKEQLIQELTRNNNDLKQFSYITSHNLRAPLSNLIGLLNLIEDIEIEDIDLKEIIEGFSKSTHLLNETINDLIKVVIIKDNLSIDKELVEIADVIQNIFTQLTYNLSQSSPIIEIDVKSAPLLYVNKLYIESIFLNLVTNALRYCDSNRKLEISISSKIIGNETIITFKDNGLGIDLNRNGEKLFGLYQRFHDYPDSKGLGLYLVKSQVVSMGGTILVESELGVGSSFIISFKNQD